MSKQLELVFSHSFKSDVWEVLSSGSRLLITTRDSEALEVSFSLFDFDKQDFLWKNISFEENWWISAYYFSDNTIVFQTYNDTQNIEARSAFGFDVISMEALWSIEDVKLSRESDSLLKVASLKSPEESFLMNINTGEEVTSVEGSLPQVESDRAIFPIHYEQENSHFETISRFLMSKGISKPDESCDYLEMEGFFAIASNFKNDTGYNLDLFVFSQEGDLLLNESLDKEMKGLATGTFFIVNQALIFVKEKRDLVFYSIS